MKNVIVIEVSERMGDWYYDLERGDNDKAISVQRPKFHACIKGKEGCWAAGNSRYDAVGDLIASWGEEFNGDGIKIKHLGRMTR